MRWGMALGVSGCISAVCNLEGGGDGDEASQEDRSAHRVPHPPTLEEHSGHLKCRRLRSEGALTILRQLWVTPTLGVCPHDTTVHARPSPRSRRRRRVDLLPDTGHHRSPHEPPEHILRRRAQARLRHHRHREGRVTFPCDIVGDGDDKGADWCELEQAGRWAGGHALRHPSHSRDLGSSCQDGVATTSPPLAGAYSLHQTATTMMKTTARPKM